MNDLVFILAILVHKEVISKTEAYAIKKCLSEGVLNNSLSQMIDKITKSLLSKDDSLDTVDAKDILK
jgi:hypothetical protein